MKGSEWRPMRVAKRRFSVANWVWWVKHWGCGGHQWCHAWVHPPGGHSSEEKVVSPPSWPQGAGPWWSGLELNSAADNRNKRWWHERPTHALSQDRCGKLTQTCEHRGPGVIRRNTPEIYKCLGKKGHRKKIINESPSTAAPLSSQKLTRSILEKTLADQRLRNRHRRDVLQ